MVGEKLWRIRGYLSLDSEGPKSNTMYIFYVMAKIITRKVNIPIFLNLVGNLHYFDWKLIYQTVPLSNYTFG